MAGRLIRISVPSTLLYSLRPLEDMGEVQTAKPQSTSNSVDDTPCLSTAYPPVTTKLVDKGVLWCEAASYTRGVG